MDYKELESRLRSRGLPGNDLVDMIVQMSQKITTLESEIRTLKSKVDSHDRSITKQDSDLNVLWSKCKP